MNPTEALALKSGERIRVKRSTSSRFSQATVTGAPRTVDRWTLVPFSFRSRSYGSTVDTISRHDHYAQIGSEYGDKIERDDTPVPGPTHVHFGKFDVDLPGADCDDCRP